MATAALPAKRKRAQVSYLDDDDDELDQVLDIDIQATISSTFEDDADDDITYGSRKKPHKQLKSRKKAKTGISAKSKKHEKPFPFLSLPAELRDNIYELALTDPEGVTLVAKTIRYKRTVGRGTITDENGSWHRRRRGRYNRFNTNLQSQESVTSRAHNAFTPALLAVNKQIHAEAVNYLYQQELVFEDTYALHSFIAAIGSNCTRVTDLVVKGWGSSRGTHKAMNFTSFTLLAGCINLKSVLLDCSIGWPRNPKGLARQIYRDGVYFLEAYGAANGKKDAAVDILELSHTNYEKANRSWHTRNQQDLPEGDDFKEQYQTELKKLLGCK